MANRAKLRLLHISGQRPDATGSGIYLQAMMREAASRGHLNFMIAGIQAEEEIELQGLSLDQCRFVRFNGKDISYRIPGMTDIMPYPSTRFRDLSDQELENYEAVFARVITETAAQFQPHIIHSHHLWLVSSLAKRLFPHIPVVATCHGTDLRQFQNCRHLRSKVLDGCSRLDAAMALSTMQKADIETTYRLPPEKVIITRAGYNDTLFTFESKPKPRPIQLVYAGKLINAKGLPWLLEALAALPAKDWLLHLVGGGSGRQKDACLRMARDLGERVVVHGPIPQTQLAALFQQAHIFVLPSLFEGLPLVILEALASGCRVVATDLPGVMEVAGGINADFISLVQTPRLKNMDQPYAEDLDAFKRNLAHGIETQMTRAAGNPRIDLDPIAHRLRSFTWRGVFKLVQKVYASVL
jgi:glycosyltransferase involved in cell wall biosynthesis